MTLLVDRMFSSTATQMTTQLLISIEHLFELNAQHVQRVSAPFIDFTVIFVIYLFQTKKQNTSMQSTKRSVSKKAVVEVKLLLSSPLSCLLIIKKSLLTSNYSQIYSRYTNNCVSPENQGLKGGRTCMHASKNTNATNVSNVHSMRLNYCSTPCCLTR